MSYTISWDFIVRSLTESICSETNQTLSAGRVAFGSITSASMADATHLVAESAFPEVWLKRNQT